MTPEEQANALARWLDGRPGEPPPDGLDPDVIEAVSALRPDLAPAPRVTADEILGSVTTGPLAGPQVAQSAQVGEASGEAEVVAFTPRPKRRRWVAVIAGGGTLGAVAAAALALLVVGPSLLTELDQAADAPTAVHSELETEATREHRQQPVASVKDQYRAEETLERKVDAGVVATTDRPSPARSTRSAPVAGDSLIPEVPELESAPVAAARPAPAMVASGSTATSTPVTRAPAGVVATAEPDPEPLEPLGYVDAVADLDEDDLEAVEEEQAMGGWYDSTEAGEDERLELDSLEPAPPSEPVDLAAEDLESRYDHAEGASSSGMASGSAVYHEFELDDEEDVLADVPTAETVSRRGPRISLSRHKQREPKAKKQRDRAPAAPPAVEAPSPTAEQAPTVAEVSESTDDALLEAASVGDKESTVRRAEEDSGSGLADLRARAMPADYAPASLDGLDGTTLALVQSNEASARELVARGRPGEAAEVLRGNVLPPAPVGQTYAAEAANHHLRAGQSEQAVAAARQGLQLSTDNTPQRAYLLVVYGDALRQLGDSSGARSAYEQAIELNTQRGW